MDSLTRKDLSTITFKGLSVYSFVEATNNFAYHYPDLYNAADAGLSAITLTKTLVPPTLLLLCCLALWYLAPYFAGHIDKLGHTDDDRKGFSSEEIHIIALSAIGVLTIVNALPELAKVITYYYGIQHYSIMDKTYLITRNSFIASLLLQLILGLWLIFRAHGIVKFIRSMRRD